MNIFLLKTLQNQGPHCRYSNAVCTFCQNPNHQDHVFNCRTLDHELDTGYILNSLDDLKSKISKGEEIYEIRALTTEIFLKSYETKRNIK